MSNHLIGKKVKITYCSDEHVDCDMTSLVGTVSFVDSMGTVFVDLDPNQREGQPASIGLAKNIDRYEVLQQA